MHAYLLTRALGFFAVPLIAFLGIYLCGARVYEQFSTESFYRATCGSTWDFEFEHDHGSLTRARAQAVAAGVGMIAIIGVAVWLLKVVKSQFGVDGRGGDRKSRAPKYRSHIDRIVHYRRNALIGILFGLGGIVSGVSFLLLPNSFGLNDSNADAVGMLLFIAGYSGVISGSWYWLKAKAWNEAVAFIGLMPLMVFLIPYIRLLIFASPGLLGAAMLMMSMILIVVVMVLPDKSGFPKRRH